MQRNRKQRDRRSCSFATEFTSARRPIHDDAESHANVAGRCRKIDTTDAIEKLRELVSDPVTSEQVPRISQLLRDYLDEIDEEEYPVKHLPAVMKVLEFLAWKSRKIEVYQTHLRRMLRLCSRPPLLERAFNSAVSFAIMEHYFTSFGYILTISPSKEEVQLIREALDCLLVERTEPINIAAVKLDFRRQAMENSRLPIIVVELLEAALPRMYPTILELAFTLASVSCLCCYRMLEAGILNTLLGRMDLPYATQLRCSKPPDIPLRGEEYSGDVMLLITSLLWSLMRSVLPPRKLPERITNLPSPRQCAMWYSSLIIATKILSHTGRSLKYRGLRYSFQRQILHGRYCAVNRKIRNDIAALILAGIVTLPSWNLVNSGIVEDVVGLLNAIEPGTVQIWTEHVRFSNRDEDFFFKRLLLMIVAHLSRVNVCVFIMSKANIVPLILRIVKSCIADTEAKESSSSSILLEHAMHVLSLLTPRTVAEFVKCKGATVLLAAIDRVLNAKFNESLAMIFARTICWIVLQDDAFLLENFRNYGMIPLLINLISTIVGLDKLTMRRQRILTLLLLTLECLMKKQTSVQQLHGEQSVELVTRILAKCLYQKNEDFQVDQRLLLAVGCYTWECVARCPANLRIFLKNNGLYSVLDVIEMSSHPVRCLYLGTLTDMCDCNFCGPFLCTWRGADKKAGLMSLLAAIWREEEDRIGIKRCADGTIADIEMPQMGIKQWTDTYRAKLTADVSPTIVDMIGSVRAKIFSILKIIERDGERYETAKEHYKILTEEPPTKDRVTLCCVDMYLRLKLGQMWTEVSRYLEQAGITPLSLDAQLISHLVQWHRSWNIFIEESQRKLVSNAKRVEEILEKDEFARIRDARLAPTLEALDEVDRIRRTTDRSYMLRKKQRQKQQVNGALAFPHDADVERCHRTYPHRASFTVVLGQHQSIGSSRLIRSNSNSAESRPVSPSSSPREETLPSLHSAADDSVSYERRLVNQYLARNTNQ